MPNKFDLDKAISWLNEKWQGPKICPICKSNSWNIGDRPVELREFHGEGISFGGPIYPLLSVTCKVCGNTILFNAIVSELISGEQISTKSAVPSEKGEK